MTDCQHDPMFTFDGRCLKCHPPKHILAVQHIDGTVEIDHLHQCGWCGEWYTGARVDHGCPCPSPIARWSTDAERETWRQEGANEAQAAADARMAEYATWQENVKDWNDIKGDCDL